MSRTAPAEDRPRIVYVVTSPLTADFLLRGQLAHMRAAGFDVTLVCSPGPRLDDVARREGVAVAPVPMRREISPLADLVALWRLFRLLRRLRPVLVNASTPKAGLLGMLAARFAGVPARVYTLRGLRIETTRGPKRRLLALTERLAAGAAHRVVAVSPSLAARFSRLGLGPAAKVTVLGAGSSNGVPQPAGPDATAEGRLRAELGLAADAPVVGFVGRLTHDKGLTELTSALGLLAERRPAVRLLLIGELEAGDPVADEVVRFLDEDPRVIRTGYVPDLAPYYRLMSVLAFPSHREGFPNVPLEAAMAGVPTVGCAVTGTVDAVVDGVTGLLVPGGDAAALAGALARYLDRPDLAAAHGEAARRRAEEEFRPERVWSALADLYRELLAGASPAAASLRREASE